MKLTGNISAVAIKQSKEGPVVVTQFTSRLAGTPMEELAEFMSEDIELEIRTPQLRMFGGTVDTKTGEVR
jgi:hypothetical protein